MHSLVIAIAKCQPANIFPICARCSTVLDCIKKYEIPTLHSIVFELLKFVFLSEVAHRSFCVKFSGLLSELRILEKSQCKYELISYTKRSSNPVSSRQTCSNLFRT